MAFEQNPYAIKISLVANSDLSTKQFRFVNLTGSAYNGTPYTDVLASATGRPFGILQNQPKQYQEAEVTVSGICKVVVGTGGVTAGNPIGTDANGAAVALTAINTGATKYIVGTALQTGAAGSIVAVAIACPSAVLSA